MPELGGTLSSWNAEVHLENNLINYIIGKPHVKPAPPPPKKDHFTFRVWVLVPPKNSKCHNCIETVWSFTFTFLLGILIFTGYFFAEFSYRLTLRNIQIQIDLWRSINVMRGHKLFSSSCRNSRQQGWAMVQISDNKNRNKDKDQFLYGSPDPRWRVIKSSQCNLVILNYFKPE